MNGRSVLLTPDKSLNIIITQKGEYHEKIFGDTNRSSTSHS